MCNKGTVKKKLSTFYLFYHFHESFFKINFYKIYVYKKSIGAAAAQNTAHQILPSAFPSCICLLHTYRTVNGEGFLFPSDFRIKRFDDITPPVTHVTPDG